MWMITALVLTFSCLLWLYRKMRPDKPPPGPKPWPIIGNMVDLSSPNIHQTLTKMAKIYGDIFKIQMFRDTVLIINSASALRDACLGENSAVAFADRPNTFLGKYFHYNNTDIGFSKYGEDHARLRQLFFKLVSLYGGNKQHIETVIDDLSQRLLADIEARNGNFDLDLVINQTLCQMGFILLQGKSYPGNHPLMHKLMKFNAAKGLLGINGNTAYLDTMPFLRFLPCDVGRLVRNVTKARDELMDELFKDLKSTYKEGVVRGMLDDMIRIQRKQADKGSLWFSDDHMYNMTIIMLSPAVASSRASFSGLFLILIHNQDIQSKLHAEIDRVIGRERKPLASDRSSMPYTEAVLFELFRYTSVSALPFQHSVSKDVQLRGYDIKKGTRVIFNLWAMLHDEKAWEDPWTFKPERFLTENGTVILADHPLRLQFAAFGFGKRSCPAEQFARTRIFLLMTTMLQRFTFLPPDGMAIPSPDPRFYIDAHIIHPKSFHCKAVLRMKSVSLA